MGHSIAIALTLTAHCCTAVSGIAPWHRVLLTDQVQSGARSLDGSPGVYYIKPGVGDGYNKWIMFWEGGGWCWSDADCLARSKTALGSSSSNFDLPESILPSSRDLLNGDPISNPHFFNWTTVYFRYTDGTSRAGDLADPVVVDNTTIYYRGFQIVRAALDTLLSSDPAPGTNLTVPSLSSASHLLITGGSAGGLTAYLHGDYIASRVAAVNPATITKLAPECGFFLDAFSIWPNREHIATMAYTQIARIANVTGGDPQQVNAACVAATSAADRWQCFMAQYTYPHISIPVFVLNSARDAWQTENILGADPHWQEALTPYKPFSACVANPSKNCNATQYAQWFNYPNQFFSALNASRAAMPPAQAARSGGFIVSCDIHPVAVNNSLFTIHINGTSAYDALAAWFFSTDADSDSHWHIDDFSKWPANPTCPGPSR